MVCLPSFLLPPLLPPGLPSSTFVYPRLPSSTLVYPRPPSSATSYTPRLPSSTLVYPRLPSSTLVYPRPPSSTPVYPRLPPSTPIHPPSTLAYPRLPASTLVHIVYPRLPSLFGGIRTNDSVCPSAGTRSSSHAEVAEVQCEIPRHGPTPGPPEAPQRFLPKWSGWWSRSASTAQQCDKMQFILVKRGSCFQE